MRPRLDYPFTGTKARLRASLLCISLGFALSTCDMIGGGRGWRGSVSAESLHEPIQARLQSGARPAGLEPHHWEHVRQLYQDSGNTPLWVGARGLRPRTTALIDALVAAPSEGLRLEAYPMAELQRALAEIQETRRPDAAQLAEIDVLLTSAFVAYGENLLGGQIPPRSVAQSWHINPQDDDADSLLAAALRAERLEGAFAQLRPAEEEYELLRRELARYRALVARGGWPSVPGGEALKPGDTTTTERLNRLLGRLRAEGLASDVQIVAAMDTAEARTPRAVYDERLAGEVARFQERHGIEVDSILGAGTVESMNWPAELRLRQIVANLERYRWLPRALGSQYVLVNVPAFQLDVYEAGTRAMSMRVVVGAEYQGRATPVFADSISFLVFQPYWNVPDGIAERDLWPRQRADPGYFARNGYEVVRAGGRTYVRQRPGAQNALGGVKFMFPNDFAIYLHDTPAGDLFRQTVRAFSNGCIRVEKPDELAEYLLRPQGWDLQRVRAAMESGPRDQQVDLQRKVPVYIVYFTTYGRDGELFFANDLYERDDRLIQAVEGAAIPSAEAVRTVEAVRESIGALVRSE